MRAETRTLFEIFNGIYMRNFTVLFMAALMAGPVAAETVSPVDMMKIAKVRAFGKEDVARVGARKATVPMRLSELAKKMKPGTTKTFGWSGSRWTPDDIYTYTYDGYGNVTVEEVVDPDGEYARTVSEYDANNMVTFKETKTSSDGVNYANNKKSQFEYDPILTNVITKRTEWMWLMDDWRPVGNCYERRITRDDAGNITLVEIAVLYNGDYDPTQRLHITYGADGRASSISEEILGYDGRDFYWEQGPTITDIVWDRTDGQIYDIYDIFIGSNRIGSGHYLDPDGLDMNVTVEYATDSDAYVATMNMTMDGMTATATSEYIPLENDGYIGIGTTYFMGQEEYSSREEVRFDEWGLMTLTLESETEEGETYSESVVGEVEYDSEGKPATYTISEVYTDEMSGEDVSEYVIRAEYSDYVDVSAGVSGVEAVDSDARWFDLRGVRVGKPEKGRIVVGKGKKVIGN